MDQTQFNHDIPVLEFSGGDVLTIKDTFEGVLICGGIGSGKTSASGRTLAYRMLIHGYAGLVLTAKPDEADMWRAYCKAAKRESDLIIVEPGHEHCFNFLEYECVQTVKGVSITQNIVALLETVISAGRQSGSGIGEDAQFWAQALSMTLSSVAGLCILAYGTVTVQSLYDIALCAPKEDETTAKQDKQSLDHYTAAMQKAEENVKTEVNAVLSNLPASQLAQLQKQGTLDDYALNHVTNYRTLKQVTQFFQRSYKKLASKTRSSIEFMVVGFLYQLLSEPFFSLFCNNASTFTPETCLEQGKIVVLNLPTKLHHETGRAVQIAIKYCFQRAWEKRDTKQNNRPAFIFADESNIFLHGLDADFQATARSSLIATVYLTQNLPGYFAAMGGNAANYKVKQFLGTLATKIFHANADADTNKYASELIGEEPYEDDTQGVNWGRDISFSKSSAERLRQAVRPEEFFLLTTGGPRNGFICEAIIHRQGATLGGKAYKRIRFKQYSIQ